MTSLSQLLTSKLQNNPYLLEYLEAGLVNFTALAATLKPTLDQELKRKSSISSISMALRRIVEKAPQKNKRKALFPAHIDISTRSGIYEVAFASTEKSRGIIEILRNKLVIEEGEYLSIAEGSYEIVILTGQKNKDKVRKILGKFKTTSELDDLACVTVNWPKITKDIPGIYYRITRSLALRKISIQSFHTIGSEMMIIVKASDLMHAHESILKLLNNQEIFASN